MLRVLGRVGTAATVAALPWAASIVAAVEECWWVAGGFAALTSAIMLWGFAPRVAGLRKLVPERRRIARLEEFWKRGQGIRLAKVPSEAHLPDWLRQRGEWARETTEWIEDNLGVVEAHRFARPEFQAGYLQSSVNERHNQDLLLTIAQLRELIRLRDEQEDALR